MDNVQQDEVLLAEIARLKKELANKPTLSVMWKRFVHINKAAFLASATAVMPAVVAGRIAHAAHSDVSLWTWGVFCMAAVISFLPLAVDT